MGTFRRLVAICWLSQNALGCIGLFDASSDEELRQQMIAESIAGYKGSCPCPYSVASDGSECGGRSAYSRTGGAEPLCHPSDISDAMLLSYREEQANK
jgi:hypothetical protein